MRDPGDAAPKKSVYILPTAQLKRASHACHICVPQVLRARFDERQCGHHAHMSS